MSVVEEAAPFRWNRGEPLTKRRGYNEIYYLTEGILSAHGEHVDYLLEAIRLGMSMVDWLQSPAYFGDQFMARKNKAAGIELCSECGGTGNWLGTMYQKCQPCKGTGGVGGTGLRKTTT